MRCELLHDPERGPGHGLLKVAPLTPAPAVVRFSLMRNQGGDRYLGPEGRWQATVYEHDASAEASEGGISVTLGPWFVDAIIEQSPAVLYQLCVSVSTGKEAGSLRVDRQRLLGSKAESRTPRQPTAPVQDRAGELEPEPESEPERSVEAAAPVVVEVPAPPPPEPRSRPLVILSVLVLVAAGHGCGGIATSRGSRRDAARRTASSRRLRHLRRSRRLRRNRSPVRGSMPRRAWRWP